MEMRCLIDMPHPYIHEYISTIEQTIASKRFMPAKEKGRHSSAFVYIVSGSTEYNFGSYHFTAEPGDIMFLSRGSVYSMDVKGNYSFIFADFDFYDKDIALKSEVFHPQNKSASENLFRTLLHKHTAKKINYREECCSLLYSIYALFLQCRFAPYMPGKKRAQLDGGLQYISQNYTKSDLSVSEISAASSMSEPHFRRLFREMYSMAPAKYITVLRVNRAKELLSYSNLSITEISEKIGFSGIYYFCRVFREKTGCTPGEYRALYGENGIV